jgi:DNA invertase Pin-like site-specific DNA recombinase
MDSHNRYPWPDGRRPDHRGRMNGLKLLSALRPCGVTGNGVSKLVFTILSAVAEAERDRTRERVAEVKRDQRRRGRHLGGKVPWGGRSAMRGPNARRPTDRPHRDPPNARLVCIQS